MASRNAAYKELVQGRRKSSDMMSPLPPDAGLGEAEEQQQPTCSKVPKKKKKKRPQEDDEREGGADAEPRAARAKSRSHDSKAELKKKEHDQKEADKRAESFLDQAGTSAANASKKVITDIWINPKETVSWNLDSLVTLNVLGRGSFGIVYLVRHRVNRQLAALKYIRKKNQNPEKERKRVEVEKSVWEAVTDHPYVVTFRAYFETAKGWCFVMEYLPEGSIRDLVRKKGPFKEETARLLSAQVALAIQHVHEKGKNLSLYCRLVAMLEEKLFTISLSGYLHRDISSSNVLIDSRGNAKLIDFGLSQIGTEAWCRCGSLAYMAPEVIRQELYGMSADWWSFGIVLFVMLVGKTPLAIYAAEKGVDLHLARRDIRYRLLIRLLTEDPKDDRFLKDVSIAPEDLPRYLAAHQPNVKFVLLFTNFAWILVALVGMIVIGARFANQCGGDRQQEVGPNYMYYYTKLLTVVQGVIILALCAFVVLFAANYGLGASIGRAPEYFENAIHDLRVYTNLTSAEMKPAMKRQVLATHRRLSFRGFVAFVRHWKSTLMRNWTDDNLKRGWDATEAERRLSDKLLADISLRSSPEGKAPQDKAPQNGTPTEQGIAKMAQRFAWFDEMTGVWGYYAHPILRPIAIYSIAIAAVVAAVGTAIGHTNHSEAVLLLFVGMPALIMLSKYYLIMIPPPEPVQLSPPPTAMPKKKARKKHKKKGGLRNSSNSDILSGALEEQKTPDSRSGTLGKVGTGTGVKDTVTSSKSESGGSKGATQERNTDAAGKKTAGKKRRQADQIKAQQMGIGGLYLLESPDASEESVNLLSEERGSITSTDTQPEEPAIRIKNVKTQSKPEWRIVDTSTMTIPISQLERARDLLTSSSMESLAPKKCSIEVLKLPLNPGCPCSWHGK
ncbi:hypothetical protein HPB50_023440 [Hyalomma asiaticum]|uniref:Uncharacterized protein n=1 Tax=Hyalomma asiaticum TaxID=266040 RepID=A0ACB7TQ82_HYAAI|nr:hypothetical protein HPB50_023440 [Hyalomma asiaticum]